MTKSEYISLSTMNEDFEKSYADKPLFIIFSHGKESGPYGTKIKRFISLQKKINRLIDSLLFTAL